MKVAAKLFLFLVFEYSFITTLAWRWILQVDFDWWKPIVVSLVSALLALLRCSVANTKKEVQQ